MRAFLCSAVVLIALAVLSMPSARAAATSPDAHAIPLNAPSAPGSDRDVHKPEFSHATEDIVTCDVVENDHVDASAISSPSQTGRSCQAMRVSIGQASHLLTGPWRFHLGDDTRWAAPGFNDLRWETTDLTPAPGAHDSDVGLTNYVSGWRARGQGDYAGYAWYRLHVTIDAPAGTDIALLAPAYVEDAYQLFWNGTLIGGSGDFSGSTPVIYSTRPQVFRLPPVATRDAVIAIRVWMRSGIAREADAGGIHIPPTLGTSETIDAQYRLQWLQTIQGYVVEVAEPVAFVLLAMLAWCFRTTIARGRFALWLCTALLLNATFRLNQAVYYWTSYENFPMYFALYRILPPLGLAAWLMAWRHWYQLEQWRWVSHAIGIITLLSVVLVLTVHDDTYAMVSPIWRVPMALLLLATAIVGLRKRQPESLLAFIVVLLVAVSQFSVEVSAVGVPGIWFPFGVGVSRTQYAYAAMVVGLAVLLIRRIRNVASASPAVVRTRRLPGLSASSPE
jgi:hypothetical protein